MKVRAAVAALALAVTFVAGPARADTTRVSVLAVVDRLIGGINVSDGAKIAAAYTPAPSIVDDFPRSIGSKPEPPRTGPKIFTIRSRPAATRTFTSRELSPAIFSTTVTGRIFRSLRR